MERAVSGLPLTPVIAALQFPQYSFVVRI
jgi:hypothetical protein